jgi:hypothetical protein
VLSWVSLTCSDLSLRLRAKSRIEECDAQGSKIIDLIYTFYITELYQYYGPCIPILRLRAARVGGTAIQVITTSAAKPT